jgi:hypothetical protein
MDTSENLDLSNGSIDSLLSTRERSSSTASHDGGNQQLSFMVIVAFTVNYVMGTGFLTIPWAFHKCGALLGTFVLFFMIGPSIMSLSLVLETLARANILQTQDGTLTTTENDLELDLGEDLKEITTIELSSLQNNPITAQTEKRTKKVNEQEIRTGPRVPMVEDVTASSPSSLPIIGKKKYETTELCELFLGKLGQKFYTLSISIFLYGTLWAYGTVFANALVTHLDIGPYSYHLFLFFFSLIVLPLSCMELSEQLYLQIFLSLCRIVMVGCMIGTVLYASYSHEDLFHLDDNDNSSSSSASSFSSSSSPSSLSSTILASYSSTASDSTSPENGNSGNADDANTDHLIFFQWSGLHYMLPIAVYSNMFHHSIPALSEPAANKRQLGSMFTVALLCCFVSYTLIGVIVSLYFGNTILSSSNLNWEHFSASSSSSSSPRHLLHLFQKALGSFVIIFPALDVSSAFPLNAITLGNNLYTTFHTPPPSSAAASSSSSSTSSLSSRKTLIFYRLLAAVPPLFFAAFLSDLGMITDYTGITGMVIVFIFPGLLSLASEKLLLRRELPTQTYYSHRIFTSRKAALFLILFGLTMILFTLTSLILQS